MSDVPDLPFIFFYIFSRGLPNTLVLTALGLGLGFLIGIALAIMSVYGGIELGWLATGYEKLFRGIPILVLIYIFAWGMPWLFGYLESSTDRALASVVLALSLRSGAYQSQIFRGSILSVNPEQTDAALALGMNRLQTFRHIIMPQALRLAVPGWSNEYSIVIKDSSFAIDVGIFEMTKAANQLTVNFPQLLTITMVVAAILYFLFTFPITRILGERQARKLKELGMGGGSP
ncbi:MAG: amino acid ABC transporter permease [Promethearchaeota archaeon]|jgi:polar amino acid transport system permease protein